MTPSQCRRMNILLRDAYGDYKQLLNKTQGDYRHMLNKTQCVVDEHDRKVIEGSIASLREMLNACERILDEECK